MALGFIRNRLESIRLTPLLYYLQSYAFTRYLHFHNRGARFHGDRDHYADNAGLDSGGRQC